MRRASHNPRRALLAGALLLVGLSAGTRSASAQPWGPRAQGSAGVRFEVLEPFGPDTTPTGLWFPLRVRMENTTGAARRARVQVGHQRLPWGGSPLQQDALIELPPRSTRELVVPYLIDNRYGTASPALEFRPEGGAPMMWDLMTSGGDTLLLIEIPALRRAVEEMIDTGAIYLNPGVLETASGAGDLALPETALDMLHVTAIAVPVRVLDRATPAQLGMLTDWVGLGGHLVLYARDESDLRRPWVRDWIGEVERLPDEEESLESETEALERDENGEPLAPALAAAVGMRLDCGTRAERGGCSRALGNGRVFLAGYDPSTWTQTDAGRVHDLHSCHAAQRANRLSLEERVHIGDQADAMMRILDPNTGFTPALGLVAFVLLAYLILVGPLNFRFVQRRNRPMLALATTPALALLCLLVLFGVGFMGKGVQSRYRSFEVLELGEGTTRALSHRYLGLYTTSPRTYDLRFARTTRARWLPGSPGDRPVRRMRGDEHVLEGITSGLWETRFVHEARFVEIGELLVEWRGSRPSAVVNETSSPITGAIVVHNADVYRLGDLAPGARAELPAALTARVTGNAWEVDPYAVARLHSAFDMDSDDEPLLRALARALAGRFVEPDCAVVYGRLPPLGERLAGFAPDRETRFLRMVSPSPALEALSVPPPSALDPSFNRFGIEPAPELRDPTELVLESLDAEAGERVVGEALEPDQEREPDVAPEPADPEASP